MHIQPKQLKPLESIQLSEDESKILKWLKAAVWAPDTAANEPIPYKTTVPQFFSGVRLYGAVPGKAGAGSLGALELFIKKLEYQGVITKQELYPVTGHGLTRFLSLKKVDLANLGVGKEEEE